MDYLIVNIFIRRLFDNFEAQFNKKFNVLRDFSCSKASVASITRKHLIKIKTHVIYSKFVLGIQGMPTGKQEKEIP